MTIRTDDQALARAVRDAIESEKPPLAPDIFARVNRRRAKGERLSLPTSDTPPGSWIRSPHRYTAAALTLTAAVFVASVLNSRTPGAPDQGASSDPMAPGSVDAACATYAPPDSSTLRHLMVSTFGVAAACGAEIKPSEPIQFVAAQVPTGTFTYRTITITDRIDTSTHAPATITVGRTVWNGVPAIVAVHRGMSMRSFSVPITAGSTNVPLNAHPSNQEPIDPDSVHARLEARIPLMIPVSIDSLTVSASDLAPLHLATWYPTRRPVGSLHALFGSDSVTIKMKDRLETTGTFAYRRASGRLSQQWIHDLTIPALPLQAGWHGVLEISPPIHPHASAFFMKGWASIALRVVGRERIKVAAGTFDSWKLEVGDARDQSYLWVSTVDHFVVRSQTTYRFDNTEFEDRIDLQRVTRGSE
jgi:hypothetical protein